MMSSSMPPPVVTRQSILRCSTSQRIVSRVPAEIRLEVTPMKIVQRTLALAAGSRSSSSSSGATGSSDRRHARIFRTSAIASARLVAWKPVCMNEAISAFISQPLLKSWPRTVSEPSGIDSDSPSTASCRARGRPSAGRAIRAQVARGREKKEWARTAVTPNSMSFFKLQRRPTLFIGCGPRTARPRV